MKKGGEFYTPGEVVSLLARLPAPQPGRFHRGIPPKSRGDYAFISHMMEVAAAGTGKVGVIVPHGVLFRGAAGGKIRQSFIEENLLEAVIGLPANLFYGTDILFIDASRDYGEGNNQNRLRPQDIERIVQTFRYFGSTSISARPNSKLKSSLLIKSKLVQKSVASQGSRSGVKVRFMTGYFHRGTPVLKWITE